MTSAQSSDASTLARAARMSERVQGFTESVIREMTRVSARYGGVNLAQGFPNFPPPKELVEAAAVTATASAQLAEIERKLQALPGEIEALRKRGSEEIVAEEARIATLAATERERLLEQTRREIEMQVRLAKRELVEHAADLSVQLAASRIGQQITPADQERLVDRYLNDVKEQPASRRAP